ncbi:Kelch repeat-containing protein [Catenovulum sediminis]|uniref:Kelch repeat-containing protein n=1 Tax=Catenovulum sediminis TaxID=1740262 RepID=A0ABV1RFS3_9ALTE
MRFFCLLLLAQISLMGCQNQPDQPAQKNQQQLQPAENWQAVLTSAEPVPRHEATFIQYKNKFYALGGRGVRAVSIYDPVNNNWQKGSKPPFQIHHFQAGIYQDKIIIAGAMTGGYPDEKPVGNLIYYYPEQDKWEIGPSIPENRRRGGAGVIIKGDNLYLAAGITNGHIDGWVNWLDVYNFTSGKWQQLPDAPRARDHFQAGLIGEQIYLVGGRRTSKATNQIFSLLVMPVDVYDIKSKTWRTLPAKNNLPTGRAGTSTLVVGDNLIVLGGESDRPGVAHNEIEAYNIKSEQWRTLPNMLQGRHGSGAILYDNAIWTCCGSGNRGGSPELTTTEKLKLNLNGTLD